MAIVDPVLIRFRAVLDRVYGDRVERVVLFGSRARGDAGPDSDYDVAVFLNGLTDRWDEVDRIADIAADIMDETGAFVHAMPYRAETYQDRTPLMHEVRGEGRDF
jgi:predicted nucleotidyltransferase